MGRKHAPRLLLTELHHRYIANLERIQSEERVQTQSQGSRHDSGLNKGVHHEKRVQEKECDQERPSNTQNLKQIPSFSSQKELLATKKSNNEVPGQCFNSIVASSVHSDGLEHIDGSSVCQKISRDGLVLAHQGFKRKSRQSHRNN